MPSGRLGTDKDVEALARAARKNGWVVSIDGGTHIRWQSPTTGEFRSPLTGGPSSALRVRRSLAALDPERFGTVQEPIATVAPRSDIRIEVAAAIEELRETTDLLLICAEHHDPVEAARLVRHSRQVLRLSEDAFRSHARNCRG